MDRWWSDGTERGGALWGGILAIVVTGVALGVAQNALIRAGSPKDGLAWRYVPPPELPKLGEPSAPAAPGGGPMVDSGIDPFGLSKAGGDIPDLAGPFEVLVGKVRELVDANGATIIDAREPEEYAAGHIPGAVNLPYDQVITDSERLEKFDAQGKPIVVYCGGAGCELSKSLGYALVAAGKRRVLIYEGGMPEWLAMGYPIAKGATGATGGGA